METRTIEETKIYYLSLKSTIDGKVLPVVAFHDYDELIKWMDSQRKGKKCFQK